MLETHISLALLLKAPLSVLITGSLLAFLVLVFIVLFLFPGVFLQLRLSSVRKRLKKGSLSEIDDLQKIFGADKNLAHFWREFQDTLHEQTGVRDGQITTIAFRATAPADAFFNAQYIVDGRLRTEFFKHLPGILTGIGIIGTFLGLITGLQAFKVSEDAGQVRESLELLLGGVFEAFLVSASAITLAMLITLIEKSLVASLYRITDDIAQYLDGLFRMGAGEDYLSRLVSASEESATQSKILKDALVGDLKTILHEMNDRQIAAQAVHSEALGHHITAGIEKSLQAPLEQIGDLVSKASGDQSATAAELLKDVMASFSERLNELFGGQITGIQELNQQTVQTMQDAVASLNQLVGRMEENSQRSNDTMAERMTNAIEEMDRRQAGINQQMEIFIESIRKAIESSQTETSAKLNETLDDLGKRVAEMIAALSAQTDSAHREQQRREKDFQDHASTMVTSLGDSVAEVVSQMATSTAQMQQSVASLERTTTQSVDKLDTSARTLEKGATAFARAGDGVTGALDKATVVANKLNEVTGALTTSSSALQLILADYRSNREATSAMLAEVRTVVETAKREAAMTQEVLERIQSAAAKLASAQQDADQYLNKVSEVLGEAHQRFADGVTRTLDRSNSEFHEKLSYAVKLLTATIQELEVTLSTAPSTLK